MLASQKASISRGEKKRKKLIRARFNPNPIAEVRSQSFAESSTSSLAPSPGVSTPPLIPDMASSPSPLNPSIYTPSPVPLGSITSGVCIHPALTAPSLLYDIRSPPSHSNPPRFLTVFATPATSPPLPSLDLRVGDLPWLFTAFPDARHPPGNAFVTIQDVLLAIYVHLRKGVSRDEYEAIGKSRKEEIYQAFASRVDTDPVQHGKGLRRVDFLCGRFRAQGLIRAQSKGNVWDVVIR